MRVDIKLVTTDGELEAHVIVPDGPARVDELVPAMQDLMDGIVELAVLQAEKAGEKVSCRAGCSACCAQLVPISEPEAFALADVVADMPEAQRRRVLARFSEVLRVLDAAGLLETLRSPPPTDAGHREMARAYFALGCKCPFLEDDRCRIYADRPFACREMNAFTPAERCQTPFDTPVHKLPIPVKMTTVMARAGAKLAGGAAVNIPLILSLEWASRRRGRLAPLAVTGGSSATPRAGKLPAAPAQPRGPNLPGLHLLQLLLKEIDGDGVYGR